MRSFNRRKAILTAVAVAAALVFTGTGAAVAAATFKTGTTVTRTLITTENVASVHSSSAFTTVRAVAIFAQAGSHIVARWTAESACYGGTGYCSARILIGADEADPVAAADFAFNSTGGNQETSASWESLSMERARTVTVTGGHTVTLQLASVGTATHRIDDWTLTVQVITL